MLRFDTEKNGYDAQQVDEYLEGLKTRYDDMYRENESKKEIVNALLTFCQAQSEWGEALLSEVLSLVPPEVPVYVQVPQTVPYAQYEAQFATKKQLDVDIPEEKPAKSTKSKVASGIVYYGALLMLLVFVFFYSQSGDHKNFFGFSYYNILTTSMQSTIPQGSFILVRSVPGSTLEVGDDITFFMDADTLVTHRIIEIIEDYEETGQYGFRTQGTDNVTADHNITFEGNVVGKVIFHVPVLGFVLEWASQHVALVMVGFAVIIALIYFVHVAFSTEEELEDEDEPEPEPKPKRSRARKATAH
jgi:signal peptidase